eukprot:scaffold2949_cov138-Skeletonema_menzelii.AAC.16
MKGGAMVQGDRARRSGLKIEARSWAKRGAKEKKKCDMFHGALGALAFFLAGQFLLSVTMSDYKVALQTPGAYVLYFKMHALCTPTYCDTTFRYVSQTSIFLII